MATEPVAMSLRPGAQPCMGIMASGSVEVYSRFTDGCRWGCTSVDMALKATTKTMKSVYNYDDGEAWSPENQGLFTPVRLELQPHSKKRE